MKFRSHAFGTFHGQGETHVGRHIAGTGPEAAFLFATENERFQAQFSPVPEQSRATRPTELVTGQHERIGIECRNGHFFQAEALGGVAEKQCSLAVGSIRQTAHICEHAGFIVHQHGDHDIAGCQSGCLQHGWGDLAVQRLQVLHAYTPPRQLIRHCQYGLVFQRTDQKSPETFPPCETEQRLVDCLGGSGGEGDLVALDEVAETTAIQQVRQAAHRLART